MKKHQLPIILYFVLTSLLFVSCKKEAVDHDDVQTSYYKNLSYKLFNDSVINCVTYNIQLGFNGYSDPFDKSQIGATEIQLQNIVNILKQINPDIISLQEVPRNRYNSEIKNFVEALAGKLDMNYAYGANGLNDPFGIYPVQGEYGNAILTKYQIKSIYIKEIEYIDQWQKRSILDVELMMNDSIYLHALSLHYIPFMEEILKEGIPNTVKYLQDKDYPMILMGDFNHAGEIKELTEIGLADSDSNNMMHSIDKILYSAVYFKSKETGTIDDNNYTSDHLATYSILKVRK